MDQSAEELRRQIDQTRDHMTTTMEAIEDRVVPSRIMERRRNRMADSFGSFRDRVMGVPQRAAEMLPGHGHNGGYGDGPGMMDRVEDRAEANPFGAGLIAFGVGMLAATLLPPSSVEKQVASQAREAMEPLAEPLQEAAHEVLDQAREHGRDAMGAITEAGTDASHAVMDTARDQAGQVREQAPTGASGSSGA